MKVICPRKIVKNSKSDHIHDKDAETEYIYIYI